MNRLGYTKYAAQGGDWGAIIVDQMGVQEPKGLIGLHTTLPGAVPIEIDAALWSGNPLPPGLSDEEQIACEQINLVMGTRPQTLAGLVDSPVGLAAYMLDHDAKSLDMIGRTFDGQKEGLTRDDVLDNITLIWLTSTAIAAARIYWENKTPFFAAKGVNIPVAVSVFPDEVYLAPKSWSEQAYPNLIHYNRLPKGGHFAAWEQPELMTAELRTAFKSLR